MPSYTRQAILHTFQDMLRELPFDKLTVSALVARCGISSNTFYYHFHDIYDLLDSWLSELEAYYFGKTIQRENWQDALKALLRDMQKNPALVYHLFHSLSREHLERYVFETTDDVFVEIVRSEVGGAPVPEETLRVVVEYNCYALLGFLLKFLWNGMAGDVDDGVDELALLLQKSLRWVLQEYQPR